MQTDAMTSHEELVKRLNKDFRVGVEIGGELHRLAAERQEAATAITSLVERVKTLEAEAIDSKLAHDCGFNAGVLVTEARYRTALAPDSK